MALHLEIIHDHETEETTYELRDENGNTVVNLTELMDGSLWELEGHDDYYVGSTSGVDDIDSEVIFDLNGNVIISRITCHEYIENRNEFIVYLNGANNDDCYNETFKYDEEFCGVINAHGDFILSPKYENIEYHNEFDVYLVNYEDYFKNGEFIGKETDQDIDNYLVFSKDKKLGILNKDGIILGPIYSKIWQTSEDEYIGISDGTKYGIYNIKSDKQVELKFDEISESFYHEFMGEGYFIARIGKQYGLVNAKMELLFNNLLDGIDEDSFSKQYFSDDAGSQFIYSSFNAWVNGKYWHAELSDDTITTRKCKLSGLGPFQKGYDYLNKFHFNQFQELECSYINVGFEGWNKHRKYQLLACLKNKIFYQDAFTNYPLNFNSELLITKLEENEYGALVINDIRQINHSRNELVIPFIYEELKPINSKQFVITGIVGKLNNTYDVYEPMQFRQIGQSNSFEEALKILKEYYNSSK